MSYNLNYKSNGFFLTYKGFITINEINASNGLMHGHEEFDSHKFQIINLLEADFSLINKSRSREPAATDLVASRFSSKVKVALVVREVNAVNFCEQYIKESISGGSPWDFKIFSELEDALQWSCT